VRRLSLLRLGLRARIVVLFALGAMGVSVALSLATYSVTRSNLLDERERTAVRAALLDAATVEGGLERKLFLSELTTPNPPTVLQSVDTGPQRTPLVLRTGSEFQGRNAVDAELSAAVTPRLIALVQGGQAAVQRTKSSGEPALVVGVPLAGSDYTYYEVTDLVEVTDTLRSLGATLTLFAALTTVAGAGLGYYAAKRLLAPLGAVATAARAIGEGDLSARLDPSDDRDLRAITRSFNTMVDQLASRLERDRRFAADVSHELRSPLQTLTAASSVLVRQKDTMDKRTGSAAVLVADEVARFAELVQDLLELARDETPVTLRDTDVPALLKEVSRGLVRRGGLDLRRAPAHWPLDAKRFERVLSNLLQNARRHGGGALRVGVEVRDGALVIEVDDEGPGVPVEERELIFDRFGRGRAASARGVSDGTGLGLALVKQHVEAHGGTVTVEDRPGGGARFVVTVPRGEEA
jgi:signal transduction histidine kinase